MALTVDNAANMDMAVRQLQIIKLGCFAHTLDLGAQKVYTISTLSKWTGRIRDAVVWIKRSSIMTTVFKEKQRVLGKKLNCSTSLFQHHSDRSNLIHIYFNRFFICFKPAWPFHYPGCKDRLELSFSHGRKICGAVSSHTSSLLRPTSQKAHEERQVMYGVGYYNGPISKPFLFS